MDNIEVLARLRAAQRVEEIVQEYAALETGEPKIPLENIRAIFTERLGLNEVLNKPQTSPNKKIK